MNINDALQRAVALHRAGQVAEAEQVYGNLLRSAPQHADGNHGLGLLLLQTGRAESALQYLQRAQQANPAARQYFASLVECLLLLNRLADARAVIERTIKKDGNSAESRQLMARLVGLESGACPSIAVEQEVRALFNAKHFAKLEARTTPLLQRFPHWALGWKVLGIALQMQGKDGLAAMQRVAELLPDDVEAQMNLGLVLQARGQFDAALASFKRAAQLKPDLAEAHNNQGKALKALARSDEAIASYRSALAVNPNHAEAHTSLGMLLQEQGQFDAALASFKRAAELKQDSAETHNNLGLVLQKMDELDGALASIRRALQLKPDYAEAHNNMGVVLQKQGQLEAALTSIRRALAIKPDYVYAHINCADVLRGMGRFEEALASDRRAVSLQPDFPEAYNNLLLAMQFSGTYTQAELFAEHLAYAQRFEAPFKGNWLPHPNLREPAKRLKIAYVSADFRKHAVACFIEPVLFHHDREQVEIYCYYNHVTSDKVTQRLQSLVEHWRDIKTMSDEQVARRIRDDEIDILVDLSGHTAGNRLSVFIKKPAPVQVSWLGYGGSTGLAAIDYRISDIYTDPPGMSECYHSEILYRLNDSCVQCFSPPQDAPDVAELPARSQGFVTFGSFNNLSKLSRDTCAAWAQVLLAVPGSRLMLKAAALADPEARQRLIADFAARGVAEERLILASWDASYFEHMNRYNKVDICLDTFSYNGFTTSFDAMWMGVPVVSLAGDNYLSRMGVSMLSNLGLPELIAQTPQDFVAVAASLAGDPERLAALRAGLRERMLGSALADGKRFTQGLEHAYREMWQTYVARSNR